jgi:transcriptional regulator
MYNPPAFREDRLDVLHDAIVRHPLGLLITAGKDGLAANLIPFLVTGEGPHGTLQAHMARANDQVEALRAGAEAMVVFQGPQAYVTPSWYPGKAEHGKVVPTWNYVVVQAWGRPVVIDDPAWLRRQIGALTDSRERSRDEAWTVEDAPESYIDAQIRGIVGLEIPIGRIEGKWKVSQNRSEADRVKVAEGMLAEGEDAMAALIAGSLRG